MGLLRKFLRGATKATRSLREDPPAAPRMPPAPALNPAPPKSPVAIALPRSQPCPAGSTAGPGVKPRSHPVQPLHSPHDEPARRTLRGPAWVVDGDTIIVEGQNIRLAGIDAPELDHPWGKKAKWELVALCRNKVVTVELTDELSYERRVGVCRLDDGRDLAAEMVKLGLALDWKKFSGGRYRDQEPPDARKRLWRVDARQKGRIIVDSGR